MAPRPRSNTSTYWSWSQTPAPEAFRRSKRLRIGMGRLLVRPGRLELPRGKPPTRPSTLRVYQFRHRRVTARIIEPALGRDMTPCSRPMPPLPLRTHVRLRLQFSNNERPRRGCRMVELSLTK